MTDEQNAVELVRRGYDEDTRCLNFRVSFYTWSDRQHDHVLSAIRLIGSYNEFDGDVIADALAPILSSCMEVSVGREGSPVLYLRTNKESVTKLKGLLRRLHADEVDTEGDTIRAWWD